MACQEKARNYRENLLNVTFLFAFYLHLDALKCKKGNSRTLNTPLRRKEIEYLQKLASNKNDRSSFKQN